MVARQERRWVWGFGLALMLLTSLPYLLGYAMQGEDWVFTGFVFGVEDGNSYLAKMLAGATGDWLFRTPYSAAAQRGLPALFAYLWLGKLTAPPAQQVQMVALFHVFRLAAGLLMCFASYDFVALFVERVDLRRWGVALAVAGGSLGWLLAFSGGEMPLDFYSPETFGFLMVYGLPHLALGRAALLWGLAAYLRSMPDTAAQGWWSRQGVAAGLWWLLLSFMQAMSVVIVGAVVGLHLVLLAVWQWRRGAQGQGSDWAMWRAWLRRALSAGLVAAPLVLYTVAAFATDPFAQAWTAQNILLSPPVGQYLAAYGLVLPLVWLGARRLLAAERWRGWLLVGWVFALPVLVYAPVNVQRRLAEGVWPVLVVLACLGLRHLAGRRWAKPWLLAALFPTTLFLLVGGLLAAANPSEPVFRPAAEVAFFKDVRQAVAEDALILAAYETGNALPVWVPGRVLIGHGPESVGLAELQPRVAAFYAAGTPEVERISLLEEFGIDYVFWGPHEQALGGWQPDQSSGLQLVLRQGAYALYRVSSSTP